MIFVIEPDDKNQLHELIQVVILILLLIFHVEEDYDTLRPDESELSPVQIFSKMTVKRILKWTGLIFASLIFLVLMAGLVLFWIGKKETQ